MPRAPRKRSKNGIYHVMLGGINRSQIFLDEEDSNKFLESAPLSYPVHQPKQILFGTKKQNGVY